MDETIRSDYKHFLNGPGGADLIKRLITTEAKHQMEGMKAATLEGKGLAMAKIEAVYELRTMLQDLAASQPVSKPVQS